MEGWGEGGGCMNRFTSTHYEHFCLNKVSSSFLYFLIFLINIFFLFK